MQFLTAMKYFGILIFMLFLLAIADLTHPLYNNRSSIGMIGCLVMEGVERYIQVAVNYGVRIK